MTLAIVNRQGWGARAPAKPLVRMTALPTQELWYHHTGTEQHGAAALRAIQRYHQDTRGWKDIAYNFLIDDDGTIYEGRGAMIADGATTGRGGKSHSICLLGNFEKRSPTGAAVRSWIALGQHGVANGWWVPFGRPHREAPGANTACPGDHMVELIPAVNNALRNPIHPPQQEELEMLIIDCPGQPALVLGLGDVKKINTNQRNALRMVGVQAKRVDDATSIALQSIVD